MHKIAVLISTDDSQKEKFKKACSSAEIVFRGGDTPVGDLNQYTIIVGNVDPKKLKQATSLKFLQLCSAGADDYTDKNIYANKNVILANASGAYGFAISEYMLAMHLSMIKKLPIYRDNMKEGLWESAGTITSISGSTVICVGVGDIGSRYAKKLKALGAYVIGIRRTKGEKPDFLDEVYTQDECKDVLSRGDVIALSLPNTKKTDRFLSKETITSLKDGAFIINVGRGNSIDIEALCDALISGKLGGAALDVTDPEPLPKDHRLWSISSALVTPHITGGFNLPQTKDFIFDIACENIKRVLDGKSPKKLVSFDEGY